jgi:hypothetical protein
MSDRSGFCECGCGQKTSICRGDSRADGMVKGVPYRFIHGHNTRVRTGEASSRWNGGRYLESGGYVASYFPNHPHATSGGYVKEHILIAEKVLGKHLPEGVVVHHVNTITDDNRNSNLVICQDSSYHSLLHKRMRALKECGHANYCKCDRCGEYSHPSEMSFRKGRNAAYHKPCDNLYRLRRKRGLPGKLEKRVWL